ncbi:hypothetical protein OG298_02940 [Streptomyces sp. NBC_01005]|uniref:hypothetical protein n=1 Tax=unclassified Streptomyces TaxID=2593676 RepID=UPI002E365F94|nr:hypothetical protein [Streptomyces sp. NBC_01362]WSW10436.1 hypothetical protein OG298_02940 [Streptomyces sp. NBC_01005]WTC99941.1 hypothetical protein OH736_02925 [Streptomyces sp. NBC_01650]
MGRRDLPESDAGGPSTEDLTGTGPEAKKAEAETEGHEPLSVPPTFPGEATEAHPDRPSEEDDRPPPSGTDRSAAREGEEEEGGEGEGEEPLLGSEQAGFRDRWQRIQGTFVDDPREAVGAADTLVAEVMQALATTFSERKQGLEGQWQRGEEVPTEELRVALQRYRSFFNRLLKT